ncbi:hypothetical protein LCGC14_0457090 [marine sediment metagenome]|uniref:Uncharacterized protein n=1 Tax=marine sediment metagenome TaxID=412755 RepID=A0A0F9SZC2_9ZZZZ|nr:hypothetical protein [Candidatus Aminicenantes bacterium]
MAKTTRGYSLGSPLENIFPEPVVSTRNPTASDTNFELGQVWVNTAAAASYILNQLSGGTATWTLMSPGASDVDSLTGDGGGAIAPTGGTLILAGGTNLTTAGTGGPGTITFNMDAAITLATSVTSPIYTSAAALDINVAAGSDITIQMGDAAGANVIDFEDSASATVATLDSDGTLTVVNLDGIIGATTPAAGTFVTATANTSVIAPLFTAAAADALIQAGGANDVVVRLGDNAGATFFRVQDSDDADVYTVDSDGAHTAFAGLVVTGAFTQTAGAVSLGDDATVNPVDIGTGAALKVVTIGSVSAASSLDLLAGTGNFSLEGNIASTYTISGTGVNTGTIIIGGGTGDQTLNLMNSTGDKTVNIATGGTNNTVAIGNVGGTSGTFLDGGSAGIGLAAFNGGNILIDSDAGTVLLDSSGVLELNSSAGVISIGNDADAQNMNFGTGAAQRDIIVGNVTGTTSVVVDVGTGAASFGVSATVHTTTLGSVTGASATTIQSGTGGIAINGVGGGGANIDIDCTGQLQINSSGSTIDIGNDAVAANMNIGTGAAARTITIGNNVGATDVDIIAGTVTVTTAGGGFDLTTVTGGNIDFTSAGTFLLDSVGVLEFNSSAGVISIGNDDIDQAVNLGTDGERTVTVGSTNGAAELVLQSGTTDITVTGVVKEINAEFLSRSGDDITFTQSPLTCTAADTGGVATGATGDLNLLSFQEGIVMEQFVIGAGQTIIKPVMTATGLLISGDETNVEGYEYNYGAARANSRHSFTIGTSAAFFMEMSFRADDISGLEPALFGFRITQANQAQGNLANYTDFAGYGLNDAVAGGDAVIQTQLNTTGINSTDTNDAWADGATHTLAMLVSGAGVVTFTFDGGAPTATQVYSFDNGDVVHPFWRHEFNAAIPDAIEWLSMKIGFQA